MPRGDSCDPNVILVPLYRTTLAILERLLMAEVSEAHRQSQNEYPRIAERRLDLAASIPHA